MADLYPAEPDEALHDAKLPEAADLNAEKATLFGTLAHLWPFIWPGERADLKMRVVWSMVLLLVAKAATLFVPFTFKWAVDALTGADTAPVQSSNWMLWLIASPLIMTLSYGAIRIIMMVLTQWPQVMSLTSNVIIRNSNGLAMASPCTFPLLEGQGLSFHGHEAG